MPRVRPARTKRDSDIADEWNRLANLRHDQIKSGADLTFHHVLMPTVLMLAGDLSSANVLDVGCGTGYLTSVLSRRAKRVTGVDISAASIEIARAEMAEQKNVQLAAVAIETFAEEQREEPFDIAVANMTLMDCLDLGLAIRSIRKTLVPGGTLVATITHPCFWPRYWEYEDEAWFQYSTEIVLEAPFEISHQKTALLSTHVHRPLEMYVDVLARERFSVVALVEPMPPAEVEARYPKPWQVPRYLAFAARRESDG